MEICGKTDMGAVRRQNQDAFSVMLDDERSVAVFVVCDGMGGARAGNVASGMAVDRFMEYMRKAGGDGAQLGDIADVMEKAAAAANAVVYVKSATESEYAGMGTTLVAAAVTQERCVIANIGDSRAYRITGDGITQVTKDHSVVEEMVDRGDITRAEARGHPKKNLITRALGTGISEMPDIFEPELREGEYLLLCSDGLSNIVEEREIYYETTYGGGIEDSCGRLMEIALTRGAPDNVTAVLFKK
ncbi:MAG: Stp1/IreP family PP2C-type Ser/Thr phosphatase [Oscillospiraceae bacterium]|jgi:protein phosphatase|nr:Stp1/IreP family PP2C-type Ser/Thr phosphatase [Oscillospiraceae bacterium]